MRKRIKLKKKVFHCKKIKLSSILVLLTIFIIIFIFFTLNVINEKITPKLLKYAKLETEKLAFLIINKAVTEELSEDISSDALYIIEKDNDGNIETIDFNAVVVNKFLIAASTNVQLNLNYLEKGEIEKIGLTSSELANYDLKDLKEGVFYKIPLGSIFNNSFLANLGPTIPVKFNLVGEILSNMNNKITNYGINNALLETDMHLELSLEIIMPIMADEIKIEVDIPIAIKLITGEIPEYYLNGYNQNTPILTAPVE